MAKTQSARDTPKGAKKAVKKKEVKEDRSGIFVPAGLFIGMGIGFLFDQLVAGLFIGLGAGFLALALGKALNK